jgi:hypothetical protein
MPKASVAGRTNATQKEVVVEMDVHGFGVERDTTARVT